uniref:PDDEXK_1 domain-containing protein n=1 Tax=Steinernema glaseri TaxID=37863 RepID=A0A1I7Z1C0_9BILA
MEFIRRDVAYGTSYEPLFRRNLLATLPGLSFTSLDRNPFADFKMVPEARLQKPEFKSKFQVPSVTFINQCTHPKEALEDWQRLKKNEMGDGFDQWNRDRFNVGSRTHKEIEKIMIKFYEIGDIEETDEEIIARITAPNQMIQDSVHSCMRSILPFLRDKLGYHLDTRMEKNVVHNGLFYNGRFDAICSLGDEGLMLVDWKTVSPEASQAGVDDAAMYGYRSQLAAYVGAINADPNFEDIEVIKKAADVMIYEDGRPAQMVLYEGDELQKYWDEWLEKLNKYWWTMGNSRSRVVQFRDSPFKKST